MIRHKTHVPRDKIDINSQSYPCTYKLKIMRHKHKRNPIQLHFPSPSPRIKTHAALFVSLVYILDFRTYIINRNNCRKTGLKMYI